MNSYEQNTTPVRDLTNFWSSQFSLSKKREDKMSPDSLKPKNFSIFLRQPASSEAPEGVASTPFIALGESERPQPEPSVARREIQKQDKIKATFEPKPKEVKKPAGSMTVRELQMLLASQDPNMTVFFYDARMMAR